MKKLLRKYTVLLDAYLQHRYKEIQELVKTNDFTSTLNEASKVIDNELRRIYRSRNMFVHEGSNNGNIEHLVVRLHEYLDTVLETVISYNYERVPSVKSIKSTIKAVELEYNLQKQKLESNISSTDKLLYIFN